MPQIARTMKRDWGYAGRGGADGMPRSTLYRIVTNPFYAGQFEFEGRLYPGKHEAMVTPAEFAAVQRLLGKDVPHGHAPKGRARTRAFAYSGLITCGHCGRAVCADRKRKVIKDTGEERFYTYYACAQGSKCRASGRIREETIETEIGALLQGIALPQAFLDYARDVAARWRAEERQAEEAVRTAQSRALTDTERQMDELLSLRLKGFIDDAAFERRQATLREQRLSILANADNTARSVEQSWDTVERVAAFCTSAQETFRTGDVPDRAAIARQLGASYVLSRGQLRIEESGLLGLVRAHNEKVAALSASLEPTKIGSWSGPTGDLSLNCPGWGALLDAIRTRAAAGDLCFGSFPT